MEKFKSILKKIIQFIANPHLLLCFGIAWLITNGWAYILFGLGSLLHIGWMVAVGSGYIAFLWIPVIPEKIVTIAIAMVLLRCLFPNDQNTLAVLKQMREKVKIKKKKAKQQESTDEK